MLTNAGGDLMKLACFDGSGGVTIANRKEINPREWSVIMAVIMTPPGLRPQLSIRAIPATVGAWAEGVWTDLTSTAVTNVNGLRQLVVPQDWRPNWYRYFTDALWAEARQSKIPVQNVSNWNIIFMHSSVGEVDWDNRVPGVPSASVGWEYRVVLIPETANLNINLTCNK